MATAALRRESVSHAPAAAGWAGTETLSSTSAVIRSKEKMIPATAAARGVRSGLPARSGPPPMTPSDTGPPFRRWPGDSDIQSKLAAPGAMVLAPSRVRCTAGHLIACGPAGWPSDQLFAP